MKTTTKTKRSSWFIPALHFPFPRHPTPLLLFAVHVWYNQGIGAPQLLFCIPWVSGVVGNLRVLGGIDDFTNEIRIKS